VISIWIILNARKHVTGTAYDANGGIIRQVTQQRISMPLTGINVMEAMNNGIGTMQQSCDILNRRSGPSISTFSAFVSS
jgi:hypothetical protein